MPGFPQEVRRVPLLRSRDGKKPKWTVTTVSGRGPDETLRRAFVVRSASGGDTPLFGINQGNYDVRSAARTRRLILLSALPVMLAVRSIAAPANAITHGQHDYYPAAWCSCENTG